MDLLSTDGLGYSKVSLRCLRCWGLVKHSLAGLNSALLLPRGNGGGGRAEWRVGGTDWPFLDGPAHRPPTCHTDASTSQIAGPFEWQTPWAILLLLPIGQ